MKNHFFTILSLLAICAFLFSGCSKDDEGVEDNNTNKTLDKPEIIQPKNEPLYGAYMKVLLFDWKDVDGAIKYSIEITDERTSSIVFDQQVLDSKIEISREKFENGVPYSFKVIAIGISGETSESLQNGFTYQFGELQLLEPLNSSSISSNTTSIMLRCEDVSYMGITGYRFTVLRDGGFLVAQQLSSTNEFEFTDLSPGTIYTWQVDVVITSGGVIPSENFAFTVQ